MGKGEPLCTTAFAAALIVLRAGIFLVALFFAVTAVLWKTWPLVLWFLMMAALLIFPAGRGGRWRLGRRFLAGFLVLYTAYFTIIDWEMPFDQLQNRMEDLHNKSLAPDPSRTLDTTDRLTIWTGNVAMGIVGYPLFPEVAWETLRMIAPGPREHVIRSDFAMRSQKVRDVLGAFTRGLPKEGPPRKMKQAEIGWGKDDAHAGYNEARVGLAVNCPFVLDATATWEKGRWTVEARGSCDVVYPRFPDMTPTFPYGKETFMISETMFWALQEIGWLHPLRATYTWTIDADDKRLQGAHG